MNEYSFGNVDSSLKMSKTLISKIVHTFEYQFTVMRPFRVKLVPLFIGYISILF